MAEHHVELTTEYTTSQVMVQNEIDNAIFRHLHGMNTDYTKGQRMVQAEIDAALRDMNAPVELPGINSSAFMTSDEALVAVELPGANSPAFMTSEPATEYTTTQVLIQQSIDEALAELNR